MIYMGVLYNMIMIDSRNANFEHHFPICSNCNNTYEPDEVFEDENYCPECSVEFQLESYASQQYQEND
jgi:acetyl-CoA carboxylase beta subunit